MGTHTFVRAQENYRPEGIRQAAFRVVLRQEIVIAFRSQRPVQLLREYVQVDQSLDRTDDWTSAFHIIVLCAEVLTYCYGDGPKTYSEWTTLTDRTRSWMELKSLSFEPLLHRNSRQRSEAQIFPEIWLLNDCHGALKTPHISNFEHVVLTRSPFYSCCPPALLDLSDIACRT